MERTDAKVGDLVRLHDKVDRIVRHVGKLKGVGTDDCIWTTWTNCEDKDWNGKVEASGNGGQLCWTDVGSYVVLKKRDKKEETMKRFLRRWNEFTYV